MARRRHRRTGSRTAQSEIVHPEAAGLDVGATAIYVAVRADRGSPAIVAASRAPTYAQPSLGARRAHRMRCQPTAPHSPCSGPAGVARGAWPPKIARGSPWRAARHQDGIRMPPKITSRCPFTPCFGSPEVCSKQSRFRGRVLSILPPSPLTATAHLKPLAQPTALRHPGSRLRQRFSS